MKNIAHTRFRSRSSKHPVYCVRYSQNELPDVKIKYEYTIMSRHVVRRAAVVCEIQIFALSRPK